MIAAVVKSFRIAPGLWSEFCNLAHANGKTPSEMIVDLIRSSLR